MNLRAGKRAGLNAAHQALALNRLLPEGRTRLRPGGLTWTGDVRPTEATQKYRLRIELKQGRVPSVHVRAPLLQPNECGRLPHVYSNGALCLSRAGDWMPSLYITETFLPWAAEWLTFYELWRATGLWYGDGAANLDAVWQASILHPYN